MVAIYTADSRQDTGNNITTYVCPPHRACSNMRYTLAPHMTSLWRFILQIVGRIRATTPLHTSCLQQHEVHPCTPYDVIVAIYTADSRQDKALHSQQRSVSYNYGDVGNTGNISTGTNATPKFAFVSVSPFCTSFCFLGLQYKNILIFSVETSLHISMYPQIINTLRLTTPQRLWIHKFINSTDPTFPRGIGEKEKYFTVSLTEI
ncbi:hypothetical protein J6590_106865 [Homalodisca vitripennis]|nr:hypothetical protein J6590_106865 [Homalodisca vitripennis]